MRIILAGLVAASLVGNVIALAVATKFVMDRGGLVYLKARAGLIEPPPAVPHDDKIATLDLLPDPEDEVIFVGDSLTAGFHWAEYFPQLTVQNHGIGGNRVSDVAARLDRIIERSPSAIYLNIGTNDIGDRRSPSAVAAGIEELLDRIESGLSGTRVVLQSVPPRVGVSFNPAIVELNGLLAGVAARRGHEWLDFHASLLGADGQIGSEFHTDGVHLTAAAYDIWARAVAETLPGGTSEP